MVADFRELLKADKIKIDEDAFTKDFEFIKGMIRFEIDNAVFGMADARRHLIGVDPQAQAALSMFLAKRRSSRSSARAPRSRPTIRPRADAKARRDVRGR